MPRVLLLLLLLIWGPLASAGVVCDGVDDFLTPALNMNLFLSTTTGTMTVVVRPQGAVVPSQTTGFCYHGQTYLSDASLFVNIGRTSDFDALGVDRVCVGNYPGDATQVGAPYTLGVPTHLTWQHAADTLTMWHDGVLIGSVVSSTTQGLLDSPLIMCMGETIDFPAGAGTLALAEVYSTVVPASEIAAVGTSRLHWLAPSTATGRWDLDACASGTSGGGVIFPDRSGNQRDVTGDTGTNGTGLTCEGATMSYPWGVE